MEYVYAALLLHKLKQNITEDNIANVIKATGVTPDDVRVKALVAALSEVNIEDALKAAPREERRRGTGRTLITLRIIFHYFIC